MFTDTHLTTLQHPRQALGQLGHFNDVFSTIFRDPSDISNEGPKMSTYNTGISRSRSPSCPSKVTSAAIGSPFTSGGGKDGAPFSATALTPSGSVAGVHVAGRGRRLITRVDLVSGHTQRPTQARPCFASLFCLASRLAVLLHLVPAHRKDTQLRPQAFRLMLLERLLLLDLQRP